MLDFLQHRPLLLLFGVAALGYLLGQVRAFGFSLGVSAVLFAGLFIGWLAPLAALPEFVPQLGLVLFVYTVGLASGPGFFASLRLRGLRDNALALGVLSAALGVTLVLGKVLGLSGPVLAGLFCGALNNTPALAAVGESLRASGASAATLAAPVLAYSICYPLGALFPLVAVALAERLFKVRYASEPISRAYRGLGDEAIVNVTAEVERDCEATARELRHARAGAVIFSRVRRGTLTSVVRDETQFRAGDLVSVVGSAEDVARTVQTLGRASPEHLELDRSEVTFRRMFVSNAQVTERPLSELHLPQKFDAVITRVRRGDVDLTANGHFELMLGDRARVVAPIERMAEIEKLLGDSARRVAEVDVITFGLGITLGLLLGAIDVPLPGGAHFALGLAGGPLVVGLVLGRLGRTGPLVWSSPYGANMTLRQFGVVLFLAGVGIKAGGSLRGSGAELPALELLLGGAAVTLLVVSSCLYVGHRLLRVPLSVLVGTLAGVQTQPAVLAFAVEKTGKELPNVGYATVFPLAMIAKILLGQLLLQIVGSP
jgi:putative transport protein